MIYLLCTVITCENRALFQWKHTLKHILQQMKISWYNYILRWWYTATVMRVSLKSSMVFVFSGPCFWNSWTRSSSSLIFSSRSFFPRDIANFSDLWMDIAVSAASSSSIVWLLSSLVLFDVTACLFLYWYSVSDDFLFLPTVWPGYVDCIWTALLLS